MFESTSNIDEKLPETANWESRAATTRCYLTAGNSRGQSAIHSSSLEQNDEVLRSTN